MKKVAFHTLGCKLNFSETSTIARTFSENGYERVSFDETPDVYVINTCSVTENADKKCRQIVKNAKKISPESFVTIIGCFAQLKPKEISEIPGVDAVLGASEKFKLLELLGEFEKKQAPQVFATDIYEAKDYHTSYSMGDRTRTFLKVQDGCNYGCAFCTIPLARGKSRSDTIENIVKTAAEIGKTEVKEIVLTGVNIGDFGIQNGKRKEKFIDLVKALDQVAGIERFRISSIEPNLLSNDIISFVAASDKFVPHFHIPLQSGNNKILTLMNRRYLRELYVDRVSHIKSLMPHCCIGVDVIVGFPGESEEDFMETYRFLQELDISYLHVFTYSERPNTRAVGMGDVVPQKERTRRSKMLRILSEKKKRLFYEQNLDRESTILFEGENIDGKMLGFSENYVRVATNYNENLVNQLIPATIKEIGKDNYAIAEFA